MEHRTVKITDLSNHPLNQQIFGELGDSPEDNAFVESVREAGILQPVVAVQENGRLFLISGHRRKVAAARCGCKEIAAIVHTDVDAVHRDLMWCESNRQREMTEEQRARWFAARRTIEEQMGLIKKSEGGKKPREKRTKEDAQNFAHLSRGPTASEIAAEEVGWSRPTAEAAAEVVEAIDEAEAAGDQEKADDLRDTLNTKSVRAAKAKVDAAGDADKLPEPVTDEAGCIVPKRLETAWEARSMIAGWINRIGKVRAEIEREAEAVGLEFIDRGAALRVLKQAQNELAFGKMYCRCPDCTKKKGCDTCRGTGYIPKQVFRRLSDIQKGKLQ